MARRSTPIPSLQLLRSLRLLINSSTASAVHPNRIAHHPQSQHASKTIQSHRTLSSSSPLQRTAPNLPTDRGPKSTEDTVTDFAAMNVFSGTPPPTTSIDACLSDGFHFDNGLKIGGGSGCLLVGGEAFVWRPWDQRRLLNAKGQWHVKAEAWGVLELVWPKPGNALVSMGNLTW